MIRTLLYERAKELVHPYNRTVAFFTSRISHLRNQLGGCGRKDEGLFVRKRAGAEGKTSSNILSADTRSLGYARTTAEVLSIVYGTGDESKPGGFLPNGGNGEIARGYLKRNDETIHI